MTNSTPYKSKFRDKFVHVTCNWLLNRVATLEYRAFVSTLMKLGRDELDRRVEEGTL